MKRRREENEQQAQQSKINNENICHSGTESRGSKKKKKKQQEGQKVIMKKIKMVALDLDGTTLNSAHSLTEGVIETLRGISQSGVMVCIATGRSLDSSLLHYINILGQISAYF